MISSISKTAITTTLGLILMTGCTTPAAIFDSKANSYQFHKSKTQTELFELTIYSNEPIEKIRTATSLHIYIGGDGTPWITPFHKSIDPTPRKQTALRLMSLDNSAAIYIGRPCYHLEKPQPNCDSKWWTSHRYSPEVVKSISQAIQIYSNTTNITLIGFSGGGTLAMLVASHLSNLDNLITVSGNLDTTHWTQQHGYSDLHGSLNPAFEPIDSPASKTHFLGRLDKNIDAAHIAKKFGSRSNTTIEIYPEYDHHCCWENDWKNILNKL